MRILFHIAVFTALILLLACGGGSSSIRIATLTSGNWTIVAHSSVTSGNTVYIGGNLTQSGSGLSAVMHIDDNATCFDLATSIPLSGSVNGSDFTLTSSAIDNQVITVTGTITNPSTLQGSYTIAGGCSGGDKGSVSAILVAPISGTWKATDTSSGTAATISGTLTQSTTATSDGIFLLSGNFTYTGSSCSISGTLTEYSFVAGDIVAMDASTNDIDGSSGETILAAIMDNPSAPTSFTGYYEVLSGACSGTTGTLTFTKQ